jgi:hypothetical protein
MTAENRKPHLQRVDLVFERSPIYFVTACMQDRRKLLSTAAIHETFLRFGRAGHGLEASPCVRRNRQITLSDWMKSLKNTISKALRLKGVAPPHWQKNIFRSRAAERRVVLRKMELCSRESSAGGACQKRGRLAVHGRDLFVGISLGVMRFGGHRPPLQK